MIVSIHQPHFLPALDYLDRLLKADVFIVLDHAPFERHNLQHRARIKTEEGARWLAVPIIQSAQERPIIDKFIDDHKNGSRHWGHKALLALEESYRDAPFLSVYYSDLEDIFEAHWDRLADVDRALLELLMDALDIRKPVIRSSELIGPGLRSDPVIQLCRSVGADALLGGVDGCRDALDAGEFERAGIRLVPHGFRHPRYVQFPCPEIFVEGLSAVDLLFNCGPDSGDMLRGRAYAYAGEQGPEGAD